MRRQLLFVCSFALLSALPILAQDALLPKEFSNWRETSCYPKPPAQGLWKETGIRNFNACQFKNGDSVVGISVGRFHDPSSAFEVYTSRLTTDMVPTNLGQLSAFDKDGVLILEGSLVLFSTANISKDDLASLVKALEAESEKGPLPPVRTYLPKAGLLMGSERYALGPEAMVDGLGSLGQGEPNALASAAGFSAGAEAMLARYVSGKERGVLILVEYPTPQLAEQHIHHFDEVLTAKAREAGTVIKRKGSLLSMVLSPSSPEYAKSLQAAVDYETSVTWNEASQTATDPPITSIMVKIFIGTGVFMVAAVVLGIAFGGVRVITKRLFPGKVFDRPEQIEVLQLGLSGKRIDPTDLY